MDPNRLNSSGQDADTAGTGAHRHGPTVRSCPHPKCAQPLQPLSPGDTLQMEGSTTCSAAIAAVLNYRRHRMLQSHKKHTHNLFCSSKHSCGLNAIPFHTKNSWPIRKGFCCPRELTLVPLHLTFSFCLCSGLPQLLTTFCPAVQVRAACRSCRHPAPLPTCTASPGLQCCYLHRHRG